MNEATSESNVQWKSTASFQHWLHLDLNRIIKMQIKIPYYYSSNKIKG